MKIVVFLSNFFIHFLLWDFIIRFKHFVDPKHSFDFFNDYFRKMAYYLFRSASVWTNLRFMTDSTPGLKLPAQFIVVANHQSLADIPLMALALPQHNIKFVAKDTLGKNIPLISLSLRVGKHALVKRKGGSRQNQRALEHLVRLAKKEGICPLIFPEGTRSKTGEVKTFHTSAVRYLSRSLNLPILTVAIDGGYRLSKVTNLINLSSSIYYRAKLLSLHPSSDNKEDILRTIQICREEIVAQLEKWKKET
jgi:1-acyl-sn-glycerol-3-phosphate acyltransferase